jgi:hypothetical protein
MANKYPILKPNDIISSRNRIRRFFEIIIADTNTLLTILKPQKISPTTLE